MHEGNYSTDLVWIYIIITSISHCPLTPAPSCVVNVNGFIHHMACPFSSVVPVFRKGSLRRGGFQGVTDFVTLAF